MSGLLERAVALFVAPADDRRVTPPRIEPPALQAPAIAVLGAPGDAGAVARLLSTELRLRAGASTVLLAEWRAGGPPPEPVGVAPPGTRRLVERLTARGIEASARGRIVHLPLPPEPPLAASALHRAVVAAGVPAVCALAGPRPAAFDPLLDEQDLVVIAPPAGASETLTDVALAGLARVRAPVVVSRPVPRAAVRLLAASSVATSRALGPAVTDAVRGLA